MTNDEMSDRTIVNIRVILVKYTFQRQLLQQVSD